MTISSCQIISITGDSETIYAVKGETVTFTVVAENADTYQWQYNSGSGWKNLSESTTWHGVTTDSLSFAANSTRENYSYHCIVSNAYATTTSVDVHFFLGSPLIIDGVTYELITATTCRVVSYSGSASSLVIPETVEGMTVTEISEEAFMDNKYLESIDLPDTITVIQARAFKNCSNLSEMK